MSWQSLEKVVTLGTERTGIAPDLQSLADLHFPGHKLSETDLVLAVLCLMSRNRRGMGQVGRMEQFEPRSIAGSEENLLSRRSSRHLDLILNGTYGQALPEFVTLVVDSGQQIPPEGLPQLLDRCLEESELFSLLSPALGDRGRWLMGFRKSWRTLDPELEPGDWFGADQADRLRWLHNFRKKEPDKARKILAESWGGEKPAHKANLLQVLRIHLSLNDEPFLEECLLDTRQEVREKAASLLTSMDGSKALNSLFSFVSRYVSWGDEGVVKLSLPDEFPSEISGLVRGKRKSKQQKKYGRKATWLYLLISRIPPVYWERHFASNPSQLLKAFSAGEWKDLWLPAITEALTLHPDSEWIDALSRFWMRTSDTYLWNNSTAKGLMEVWPADTFNERCIGFLQHHGHRLDERSLVTYLLKNSTHYWQDKLTLLVIENFQNWLSSSHAVSWGGRFYRDILNALAFRSNPQLLGAIRRNWRVDFSRWDLWEGEIEWLFKTLFFRSEMRSAFTRK